MNEFPFDTTYYYKGEEREMAELFLDIPELFKLDSSYSSYSKQSNAKYRFLVDYFLIDKLYEFIKQPPNESYLGVEWKESEGGVEYASLRYLYKSTLKLHRNYVGKLDKVFDSDKFRKGCLKDFDKAYEKNKKKS